MQELHATTKCEHQVQGSFDVITRKIPSLYVKKSDNTCICIRIPKVTPQLSPISVTFN